MDKVFMVRVDGDFDKEVPWDMPRFREQLKASLLDIGVKVEMVTTLSSPEDDTIQWGKGAPSIRGRSFSFEKIKN